MDDESHIRLVDSHSESICADHHTDRTVLPQSLAFGPGLPSQTCVVEAHRNPRRLHHGGKFLALAAVAGIDYSASGNPVADVQDLSQLVFGTADNIGQVRPLEPALEKESVTETQFLHDIVRHDRSGCRRQGYDRGIQGLPQFADPEIVRAEIIAPLGNAVSLIDNDIAYIKHVQIGPEQHRTQSFRRQVQELDTAIGSMVESQIHLVSGHTGMYGNRFHSPVAKILDLVLHQCDKRSDNDRKPPGHQTGNLEADRFSASGRHDCQHILPFDCGIDDFLLHRAEGIIAPVFFQNFLGSHAYDTR